ncbi:zinc ribbon domain-containing protein [Flavobacterium psychraquaticum]|uniref:zinc ribbon domain-containing protein n=1 Tax=Flavobacterium psychraquaticum TaxID=3103958 RepID=UPI002ACDFD51|nr:C4-type zinc ribbon domain-containing protein [Flavobacterium sp. LB-N7T]
MATIKEVNVEDKLRALFTLQLVDSKIDEIRNVRGELPLEVDDLEDEVAGLSTRLEKLKGDLDSIDDQVKEKKNAIDVHKAAIKKYLEQQKNVRNNREFNSLTKEVEFQELEIQLAEKQIKELKASIDHKKEVVSGTKERLDGKQTHLKHKKAELSDIMAETEKEEKFLSNKSAELRGQIEERLLAAYDRIRNSVRNGLAVVSIERGASAGSFFTIPPQTQMEIAARKKIITDEHSGRILVDGVLADEEREKMDNLFASI